MKERPILFSGAMVRAILDGKKTQTRRVISDQPWKHPGGKYEPHDPFVHSDGVTWSWMSGAVSYTENDQRCPYGQPGDRLWVRERHAFIADFMMLNAGVVYVEDGAKKWLPDGSTLLDGKTVYNEDKPEIWKHRPSIHMPRWASRITLELTDVRVQRLQEVSEADTTAEGCEASIMGHGYPEFRTEATTKFRNLWDTLNEKRGYGWGANPWVWALTFKRVEAGA